MQKGASASEICSMNLASPAAGTRMENRGNRFDKSATRWAQAIERVERAYPIGGWSRDLSRLHPGQKSPAPTQEMRPSSLSFEQTLGPSPRTHRTEFVEAGTRLHVVHSCSLIPPADAVSA